MTSAARHGARVAVSGSGTLSTMRGAVMYGPGDVRVEERAEPRILAPTDAILRLSVTCICGLWPWRGVDDYGWPAPMGPPPWRAALEASSPVRTAAAPTSTFTS